MDKNEYDKLINPVNEWKAEDPDNRNFILFTAIKGDKGMYKFMCNLQTTDVAADKMILQLIKQIPYIRDIIRENIFAYDATHNNEGWYVTALDKLKKFRQTYEGDK